ncbi:MAG: cation-translocating P-type ATPase [Cytophaga sp.]|uniref:cation-translocating P-type ATPase n=1 Tax=Cytophaga sp. TaxID=29535 RepID=UPI003F8105DF
MAYYKDSINKIFNEFGSSISGLSKEEAAKRITQYGYNELQEKKKVPAWLLFLNQFKDIMIIILFVAAVLSGIVGDLTDTIIILIIIILNALIGFVQEFRAEQSMEALKKMSTTQTQVLRNNESSVISSTELVPGDIVLMEAGNVVPADIRLIDTHSLRIDESSLTGESMSVDKISTDLTEDNISLGDQVNMAFKGTLITNGRATGIVISTGMQTELGKIAGMLHADEVSTPLQYRMQKFGKNLSYIILFICLLLFTTGVLRGEEPLSILLLSVSLAVAAIPEALPALITIALSKGASHLTKVNALIRKLPAVETLGSVTYICSDKTGTLTQNKMKVIELYEQPIAGLSSSLSVLQMSMALNHDVKFTESHAPFGEPTELALVEYIIHKHSFEKYILLSNQYSRVAELPFDSDRKCMTTIHHFNNKFLVITKGASESLYATLTDEDEKSLLLNQSEEWAAKGIRVLAFAYSILDKLPEPFTYETVEKNLIFAGLAGLMDPPREEAKLAIQECKTAGIRPVMITGDHPATARAIGRQIGILDDNSLSLTGAELNHLSQEDFLKQVENTSVYARVSPEQKLRIVKALQEKGHYVAMTGDGVNDAPSLKAANIGVAMGITGTDVSKEASDVILLDDNFATIVKAVKEGRRIFDNIRKFVKYIMTCNGAEIWTIFMAPFLGMPMPLLPIHILWINLVTDGLPALTLADEKAEADIMQRPPRHPSQSIFADGLGYHIVWVGILMAGVTLATQKYALVNHIESWQTMVFTVLSLSQLVHVLSIRSDRTYLFQQGFFSNKPLVGSVALTVLLQLFVIYVPFMNTIFKTQPLSLTELGICIGMSLIIFHAVEFEKFVRKQFHKK